jgi:hypothetical protein
MDWEYLLRMAHRHEIAPLLYWHLDATCSDGVPADVFDHLRDHFRANSSRNLFLTGELLRLLNAFEAQEIPAVPYKGPALAAFVYGNLALRKFNDLDILVHPHEVPKAKKVLACMGYQGQYRLTRTQEAAFLRSQREQSFRRDDGKSIVDLHWGIAERHFLPLDAERLWERLNRIQLGGNVVSNLSPEDMLLMLCAHGSKHVWERLKWICDVAQLVRVRQKELGWEQVMGRARVLGSERMLLLGLFLASDLLGATLPERVSQRVRADPTVKALAERTREQLFRESDRSADLFLEGREGAPAFHTLHFNVRERLQDKIRYGLRKATTLTGEDWDLLSLPRVLFPFYYVLRLMRLTRKYGPRIWRHVL